MVLVVAISVWTSSSAAEEGEVWTFNRLDRIGGHTTTVLGSPRLIDTPLGKAVEFNGVDSALVVDVHPLAGAATFTWEAIFRPDGGEQAQRWLHLQETGTENRMLFELRIVDNQWYFDSFVYSGTSSKALIDPNAAPVRSLAANGYLLAFDNVSGLPIWLSDALCRLASGGSFAVRQLYTDDAEVLV